jgi:hypothetical protein
MSISPHVSNPTYKPSSRHPYGQQSTYSASHHDCNTYIVNLRAKKTNNSTIQNRRVKKMYLILCTYLHPARLFNNAAFQVLFWDDSLKMLCTWKSRVSVECVWHTRLLWWVMVPHCFGMSHLKTMDISLFYLWIAWCVVASGTSIHCTLFLSALYTWN